MLEMSDFARRLGEGTSDSSQWGISVQKHESHVGCTVK